MNGKKPVVLGFNNYHNKYINSPDLDIYIYISHKTTRVVKTCPPCMFNELEDRKSYENHVIDLGKMAL